MATQFPALDTVEVRDRVIALGRGAVAAADGPERHFLKVLAGKARCASPRESAWLEYWQAHADIPVVGAAALPNGVPAAVPESQSGAVSAKGVSAPTPPNLILLTDQSPQVRPNCTPAAPANAQHKRVSLIDLAVDAANIAGNINSVEELGADPLVARAIEMTTNRSLSDLAADPDSLLGTINTVKGKYFELLVEKELNAGESFGDLSVAADQKAALAASMNQPGWDIAITDNHQHLADVVQLKATDSIDYIKHTLERYPDIKIITTSEAAHGDMVIDSGISNHDIEQVVGHAVGGQSADFLATFIDCFNPLFPLIYIVASEGYKISVGKASVDQALESALVRAKRSVTGGAVGALFYAMGFPLCQADVRHLSR